MIARAPTRDSPRPPEVTRRSFLKLGGAAALTALAAPESLGRSAPSARAGRRLAQRVVVVGAGAFGGWTALQLLRMGARVTLVDAWDPGNSRSSSGGDTRIIRATYSNPIYIRLALRALELWKEHETRWGRQLYVRTGSLRMRSLDDRSDRRAMSLLEAARIPIEELSLAEAAKRYPQIDFDGVRWVFYEPGAGYLHAREACRAVFSAFIDEGGEYRRFWASPGPISGRELTGITGEASLLRADQYVFACGPWLREVTSEVVGDLVMPTRQETFYFGTPRGDGRFLESAMPAWVDWAERVFYGIPGNAARGFKVADDTRGPRFDPTNGDRRVTEEGTERALALLARRFPALRNAPILETRVCQYENSPDFDFIVDRHPLALNMWIVGGGSGHGFKHGPALGEMVARMVLNNQAPEPAFALSRFWG